MTSRIKRAETVQNAITKAENRAASSGSGGNEVNAIRQNIRAILDNPKKRRQFSREQLLEMGKIVRGTGTTNALRAIGKLSPTSGALPLMGLGASSATFGAAGAVPSAVGWLSKSVAEGLTRRQVVLLDELVRNNMPLDPKQWSRDERQALVNALSARLTNGETENTR